MGGASVVWECVLFCLLLLAKFPIGKCRGKNVFENCREVRNLIAFVARLVGWQNSARFTNEIINVESLSDYVAALREGCTQLIMKFCTLR
ncbi:Hypothetical predicted protein [Cloeon dipterum]|uniref:Calponin-homology (CH) domain-containing protein n=1 Tax=Cloeon dipterum TaxID=197152 RepID=A0A8S1DVT4_9INSE|nr:Hypothetical predicted protein [Cloeon dipterum]